MGGSQAEQRLMRFASIWRARQESNLHLELRRLSFYPLNYGREAGYCSVFAWNFFVARPNTAATALSSAMDIPAIAVQSGYNCGLWCLKSAPFARTFEPHCQSPGSRISERLRF